MVGNIKIMDIHIYGYRIIPLGGLRIFKSVKLIKGELNIAGMVMKEEPVENSARVLRWCFFHAN